MVRPENIKKAIEALRQSGEHERFAEFTGIKRVRRGRDLSITTFVEGVVALLGDEDTRWLVILLENPLGVREVVYLPAKYRPAELRAATPEAVRWLAVSLRLDQMTVMK
jgi:hypothetical protein